MQLTKAKVYENTKGKIIDTPLTEKEKKHLLELYREYVEEIHLQDYYRFVPEELFFYPFLDFGVMDLQTELFRGNISQKILYILSRFEGPAIAVNSKRRTGIELDNCEDLEVCYKGGSVVYEMDYEKGFATPRRIIISGPSYPDGFPIVNRELDATIELDFQYPDIEGNRGLLTFKE